MIVVVEGCDGSGKSTLAGQIAKQFPNTDLIHFGPCKQSPLLEYGLPLVEHRRDKNHLVFDRFHLGEWVYPRVLHYRPGLTKAELTWLDMILEMKGAVLVLAESYPAGEEVQKRLRDEKFIPTTPGMLRGIQQGFRDAANGTPLFTFTHNIDSNTVADPRLVALKGRQNAFDNMNTQDAFGCIGAVKPDILLVGDTPDDGCLKRYPFAPFAHTPGEFLFTSLYQTRTLPQAKIAVVNAFLNNGHCKNIETLWHQLFRPKVVALGKHVSNVLFEMRVPHGVALHPAEAEVQFQKDDRRHMRYLSSVFNAANTYADVRDVT